ncbi:MAG: hypothetical protein IT267_07525 [Saprospiraceae bacterium]|nr:hypothetical protein [Saprospiraceae bacterium]
MNSITGDHYTLGLYHGEESGNLVIYLNNDIFIIDFKVMEDKEYSFFIGNELMKLEIKRNQNEFNYELKVDQETDTPLNSAFKKRENEDEKLLLTGLIVVSILLLVLFIFNYYARYSK